VKLVDILKKQLGTFGYEQDAVRTLPIMQSKNVVTDHLVYATKDPLGNKIWQSIAKTKRFSVEETLRNLVKFEEIEPREWGGQGGGNSLDLVLDVRHQWLYQWM
jgi:hypothetical protein